MNYMTKRLNELTIGEARSKLDADEVSSVELTKACLDEIKSLNGALNAVLETFEEDAIEQANRSDDRRSRGERNGLLDGIPIALKDNILNQGKRATAGSKILDGHVSAIDAIRD